MSLVSQRSLRAVAALGLLWAMSPAQAQDIDFSGGFNPPTNLTLNGNATAFGSSVILTPDQEDKSGSVFYNDAVNISQFSTRFTFRIFSEFDRGDRGDGLTFTIQRDSVNALGGGGTGLGYGGISSSVAVAFDIFKFDNDPEPSDSSVSVVTGGSTPYGAIDTLPSTVDLRAGGTFEAVIGYNGSVLQLDLTDLTTNAVFSQSFNVDIPTAIGESTGYVGFTAATGALTAQHEIQKWHFTSPVPAPSSALLMMLGGGAPLVALVRKRRK